MISGVGPELLEQSVNLALEAIEVSPVDHDTARPWRFASFAATRPESSATRCNLIKSQSTGARTLDCGRHPPGSL
jgi:hypothetical protein